MLQQLIWAAPRFGMGTCGQVDSSLSSILGFSALSTVYNGRGDNIMAENGFSGEQRPGPMGQTGKDGDGAHCKAHCQLSPLHGGTCAFQVSLKNHGKFHGGSTYSSSHGILDVAS